MKWLLLIITLITTQSFAIPWKQDKDFICLSETLYHEARGEDTLGQYLVGKVILNRLYTNSRRSTICGVVYERSFDKRKPYACQFSFTCSGRKIKINKKSDEWEKALRIADKLLNENPYNILYYDLSKGAMFYTRCGIRTTWMKDMKLVIKHSNHCFYKEDIKYVK